MPTLYGLIYLGSDEAAMPDGTVLAIILMYVVLVGDRSKTLAATQSDLNMAARIQKDMLPSTFPLFPEREEFEIYADHVPFDGSGFMYVLETFFYHYYCILDGIEYPVPEGVHTEKGGVAVGQDIDAYLEADPVDPKASMGAHMGKKTFELPESPKNGIFVPRSDCRGFSISIPSGEFMSYAKSVKGSPMSVFYVLFSKALQRVHPENTLPFDFLAPVSIRKVMGDVNSLLH